MKSYRVVLNTDGTNRNYVCESYFDAVVLFDLLCQTRTYRTVEIWEDHNYDTHPIRQSFYGKLGD